ncbi:MAG: amidohydrolase, partial [Acidobacteria bacterium]|nr:amidohydrolase [Acidobacteriota bacterium]
MSPAGHGPGLVLVNGAIWTGSNEVEALAIRGDRVVAVGSKEESEAAVGRDARTIDLGGHRVVPGLIDSHLHFLRAGVHW